MKTLRRRAVLVLLAGLAGGSALAQKPPDPQSTYEPRSEPGEGQKFLEKLAGDWDVIKTFHPREGDPVRANGSCKQTMINDGRFLKSEFVFEGATGKTVGIGLIGFEPETGLFTSVWADSRSTRMSLRRSDSPFDGKQIVLYGRSLDTSAAAGPRSRTETRLEEDGRVLVHRQYVPAADGKERLIMELRMTRR